MGGVWLNVGYVDAPSYRNEYIARGGSLVYQEAGEIVILRAVDGGYVLLYNDGTDGTTAFRMMLSVPPGIRALRKWINDTYYQGAAKVMLG